MTPEYSLENLEPRTLLSATLSRHGVLYVVGTHHADTIAIYTGRLRHRQVVTVYVNRKVQTFRAASVRSIVVVAGRGNDRVTFIDRGGRVPGRHFLYGGAGSDCLIGDAGDDYIDAGGDVGDSVSGGGGEDDIIGSPQPVPPAPTTGPTTQPTSGGEGDGGGGGDTGATDGSIDFPPGTTGSSGGDFGGGTDTGSGDSGNSGGGTDAGNSGDSGGDSSGGNSSDGGGGDSGDSGDSSGGDSGGEDDFVTYAAIAPNAYFL